MLPNPKFRMQWRPGNTPKDQQEFFLHWFYETKKGELEAKLKPLLDEATQWMKDNAPWEDRTGHAREELRAEFSSRAKKYIVLWFWYGPNVDYAKFLESMQAGRFSILGPAEDYWSKRIYDAVKEVMQ